MSRAFSSRLLDSVWLTFLLLVSLAAGGGCGPDDLPPGILPGQLVSYEPTKSTSATTTTSSSTPTTSTSLTPLEPAPSTLSSVLVESQPLKFSSAELETVKAALRQVPLPFLQHVQIRRARQDAVQPDFIAGLATQLSDGSRTRITFFDLTFATFPSGSELYPAPPYSTLEATRLTAQHIVIHEFTHNFQFTRGTPAVDSSVDFLNNTPLTRDWASQFGWTVKPDKNWTFDRSRCAERPTSYAITTHPIEDQAESVALVFGDLPRLRAASDPRATFAVQRFGVTPPATPAVTVPPDRVRFGPECPPDVATKAARRTFCRVE